MFICKLELKPFIHIRVPNVLDSNIRCVYSRTRDDNTFTLSGELQKNSQQKDLQNWTGRSGDNWVDSLNHYSWMSEFESAFLFIAFFSDKNPITYVIFLVGKK